MLGLGGGDDLLERRAERVGGGQRGRRGPRRGRRWHRRGVPADGRRPGGRGCGQQRRRQQPGGDPRLGGAGGRGLVGRGQRLHPERQRVEPLVEGRGRGLGQPHAGRRAGGHRQRQRRERDEALEAVGDEVDPQHRQHGAAQHRAGRQRGDRGPVGGLGRRHRGGVQARQGQPGGRRDDAEGRQRRRAAGQRGRHGDPDRGDPEQHRHGRGQPGGVRRAGAPRARRRRAPRRARLRPRRRRGRAAPSRW